MVKRFFGALLALTSLTMVAIAPPALAEPLIVTTAEVTVQVLPTGQRELIWMCAVQSTIEPTIITTISMCDANGMQGVEPVSAPGPFVTTGGAQGVGGGGWFTVCQIDTAPATGGPVTESSCDSFFVT